MSGRDEGVFLFVFQYGHFIDSAPFYEKSVPLLSLLCDVNFVVTKQESKNE